MTVLVLCFPTGLVGPLTKRNAVSIKTGTHTTCIPMFTLRPVFRPYYSQLTNVGTYGIVVVCAILKLPVRIRIRKHVRSGLPTNRSCFSKFKDMMQRGKQKGRQSSKGSGWRLVSQDHDIVIELDHLNKKSFCRDSKLRLHVRRTLEHCGAFSMGANLVQV